jgi:UDPglucose--hexose-1-phosphate uridylyltransferase
MELRKDYMLDRWVVIASDRKKRRREFKKSEEQKASKTCFFCPGNEETTPPEIGRIEENGKWIIRWFPNKFPAVKKEGDPVIKTDNDFFTFSNAYGNHEVIAECPEHDKQLWDLDAEHIKKILYVYRERINNLAKEDNIKYVTVFKNHGGAAGTSLIHSHTQVASINMIPTLVKEEVIASKKFDSCPYCRIISIEKNSDRRCFENNSFIAFTPYASRFNYEVWIFPKKHIVDMNGLNDDGFKDLAEVLKKVLIKLKELNAAYNFFLHYAPEGNDLHFHIEVTPRFANWAGFEFSSDIIINSVAPEDAAKFYRDEE